MSSEFSIPNTPTSTFSTGSYTPRSSPQIRPAGSPKLILDLSTSSSTPPEIAKSLLEAIHSPTLPCEISCIDVDPRTEYLISNSAITHRLSNRPISKDMQDWQRPSFSDKPSKGTLLVPVGTKIATASIIGAGRGELRHDSVRQSAITSLQRMGILGDPSVARSEGNRLHWLIAQRPDIGISYGEMVGGFAGLVGEGICEEWGVRDFPLRNMKDLLNTCERRGYTKPKVYQGEYNVLSQPSDELFKVLRTHGVTFQAYAPTAWGALNGLIIDDDEDKNNNKANDVTSSQGSLGSINNASTTIGGRQPTQLGHGRKPSLTAWRGRFDTAQAREAVKIIRGEAQKQGISASSVGIRWLAYHSQLGQGDGILVAAKSSQDLERQLADIAQGPLPEQLNKIMADIGRLLK